MKKTVMILVLLAILGVLVGAFIADQYLSRVIKNNTQKSLIFENNKYPFVPKVSESVTISGSWSCLPAEFSTTDGKGCVLGVKEAEGKYYLISTVNENPEQPLKKIQGESVTLTGSSEMTVKTKDGSFVNFFSVDFNKESI